MKVIVIGKTACTLTLNKVGMPIRGQERAVVDIDSEEKKNEIIALKKAGYLDIIDVDVPENKQNIKINESVNTEAVPQDNAEETGNSEAQTLTPVNDAGSKKKIGRPKGSKNKKSVARIETRSDQQRADDAEARTQEMGSRVIIANGDGNIETRMRSSFEGEFKESEATKASLETMAEIKEKESWTKNKDNTKLDDSMFDPSEQMGRPATIVHEGSQKKTPMSKSIIPSQEQMSDNDPFIDDKAEDPVKNAFIDPPIDDDDDSFLKI